MKESLGMNAKLQIILKITPWFKRTKSLGIYIFAFAGIFLGVKIKKGKALWKSILEIRFLPSQELKTSKKEIHKSPSFEGRAREACFSLSLEC